MRRCVIDGAQVLLPDGRFERATVSVEGGTIAAVASAGDERAALRAGGGELVDAHGSWLAPGLISAHTHAYGTLLRGTQSALPLELWSLSTVALGAQLDEADIVAATLLHDAECIRSGITGIVDHFPHVAHAWAALAAHEASGLRVLFAPFVQDISDYDLLRIDVPLALRTLVAVGAVDEAAYEAHFADLVAAARGGSGRVRVALGPNAPQRCSPALWALWRRLRDRHGVAVHCHALETRAQARIARERWPEGGLIVALDDAGLLVDGLSLAHAVHTSAAERELLARRNVAVAHNPLSNLTLGSGMMPLIGYIEAGVPVGLGTDAANCGGRHDVFELMRLALTLPRAAEPDYGRWPSARAVLDMATVNGRRIIGERAAATGIAVGAAADLVILREDTSVNAMAAATVEGFIAHAGRDAVDAVMIDGRWALRDGRIVSFDEVKLLRDVAGAHARIAERVPIVRALVDPALAVLARQLAAREHAR